MADNALSEDEQQELMAIFEKVETEELDEGTHQRYVQIANDLAERYGVSRAAADSAEPETHSCGHSCSH